MSTTGGVRVGMRVVDSAGEDVGTVEDVRGGGQAGSLTDDGGLLHAVADAFGGGSNMHPQAAERLQRVGYIRIDRKGFLGGHGYVAVDQVESVDGDVVRLSVAGDQLLED